MNMDADALSRIPRNGYHELDSLVVKALLKSSQETDWTDFNGNPSEIACKSCQMIFDINVQEERMQFVLPRRYWSQALEACHDNVGHLGIEITLSLLRDQFYWPNMAQDVEAHVKSCPRCLRFKKTIRKSYIKPYGSNKTFRIGTYRLSHN